MISHVLALRHLLYKSFGTVTLNGSVGYGYYWDTLEFVPQLVHKMLCKHFLANNILYKPF